MGSRRVWALTVGGLFEVWRRIPSFPRNLLIVGSLLIPVSLAIPLISTLAQKADGKLRNIHTTQEFKRSNTEAEILAPASGAVLDVGAGQTYTSLTNPGGLFEALNAAGISGDVTANITSDLTAETGAIALNHTDYGSGSTITIQPSGAARLISGTVTSGAGMISIIGGDRVVFDGSAFGGHSLTIENLAPSGASSTIHLNSTDSVTIKNCIVRGRGAAGVIHANGSDNVGTLISQNLVEGPADRLVSVSDDPASVGNGTGTIEKNELRSFSLRAIDVTETNVAWLISENDITQALDTATSVIRLTSGVNVVSRNVIRDVLGGGTSDGFMGIEVAGGDQTISANRIYGLNTMVIGGDVVGISANTSGSLSIWNNMVSLSPTGDTGIRGIRVLGTSSPGIFYNSVYLGGSGSILETSTALHLELDSFALPVIWNNIFFNGRGSMFAGSYAVTRPTSGNFQFINYNIYAGKGQTTADNFFLNAGTELSFTAWKALPGFARDANSLAGQAGTGVFTLSNIFVSATDLHALTTGPNPASNAGTPLSDLTTDFDGQTRSATAPDIGADEFSMPGTAADASISGRVLTSHGRPISGAIVRVQDANGLWKTRTTNTLGYYRFEGLQAGETYIVSVSARRYQFAVSTQLVSLLDSVADLNFVGTL